MARTSMNDHFIDNQMNRMAQYVLSYTSIQLVLPNAVRTFNDMYTRMIDGIICEMRCVLPL